MSNHNTFRLAADVSATMRAELLRMFPPRLSRVYCSSITMGYRVPGNVDFPAEMTDAVVYGVHRSPDHEALLVRIGGETLRPDGTPFFLTLSTGPGVAPVRAGEVDHSVVEYLENGVVFGVQFKLFPLWQQQHTVTA